MNRQSFLTVRWNNLLSLGLGAPALAYAGIALATTLRSSMAGFIAVVAIGVLY